ncbi:CHAD domain-containing protein [Amycolatopsis xylanica]|uniref:CHAD domain-containing protein n=1 Tax=Amycolatopsis xylanica TaxID=589385 RepID=A0A1H3M9R2_9PSEU|nr:CHAD domain-containing protein [Amycolatopsis xylanica]SDY73421.1 CHAD domain-containing protein [Amycolatopsis xylanica]
MTAETLPAKKRARRLPKTTTPAELGLGDHPAQPGPGDPPVDHLRAQLDTQIRELIAREPGTRSGADPEDLHQMRVALRRMRSTLKLSGGLLGPEAETVRAELGWLGQSLGEVRDYDVLIEHLREVVAEFEARDQLAGRELVSKFVAERGVAKRKLTRLLGTPRYAALLVSAARLVTDPSSPVAVSDVESPRAVISLDKPYRKLAKAVGKLPLDPPDDDLHALRIHGKRLRYAAELAQSAAKKKQAAKIKKLISATKDLQTVLGDHQDAVVAADRMRAALDTLTPQAAFIAGRIAERELTRRTQARAAWPAVWAQVDTAAAPTLTASPLTPG